MNSSHFNSLCGPKANKQKMHSNWTLLNRTWSSFIDWMRDQCWWGSVSQEQIVSSLNRPEVAVGAIAIAGYFGDMVRGVCSGMVKYNKDTIIPFGVFVRHGYYRCTDFVQWPYENPVTMIRELIEEVPHGYLMAKPKDVPNDNPNDFSGTHVVEEMCEMIRSLGNAWWGLLPGSSPMLRDYTEVEKDLLRQKTSELDNPSAAICYMSNDDPEGYLFEIVTSEGNVYKVTFDKSGFFLGEEGHFSTMKALVSYMSRKVNFVSQTRKSGR